MEAYVLRPGFLLTVSRDEDGRLEDMVIEKATVAGRSSSSEVFTERLAAQFVDDLAPPEKRGGSNGLGSSIFCSASCSETHDYEFVTVTQVFRDLDPTRERIRLQLRWHAKAESKRQKVVSH